MKTTQSILLAAGLLAACTTGVLAMGNDNGSRTRNLRENDRDKIPLPSSTITNRVESPTGGVWRSSARAPAREIRLAQNGIGSTEWSPGIGTREMTAGGVTGSMGGGVSSGAMPTGSTGLVGGAGASIPNVDWQSGGAGSMSATGSMGGGARGTLEPNAGSSGGRSTFGTGAGSGAGAGAGTGTGMGTGAGGSGTGL